MDETLRIFSTEIKENHVSAIYSKNYHSLHTEYLEMQREWLFRAYSQFKDLDKYFILISLVKKTLAAYNDYLLKYSWDDFFSAKEVELQKFSIVDISKELCMSKETARRKILELEEEGVLAKDKKSVKIKRDGYEFQKPINTVKTMGKLLSQFSKKLYENNIVSSSKIIEMYKMKTSKLFSFCCVAPFILASKNKKEIKFAYDFGQIFGLLFQITDDLIDYKGITKKAGKKTKKDEKKGKATLISLLGYKNTIKYSSKIKNNILNKISYYGKKSESLKKKVLFIFEREK